MTDAPTDDFALLAAWRAGDRTAGSVLFERYAATLVRFFRNKVDDSEDLIQATMLACVEGRDRFEGRGTFRTYLLGIARFQLYAHLRKLARRPSDVAFDAISVADLTDTPGRKIDKGRRHSRLLAALRQLTVDQQLILELTDWESLEGPELAEVMGLSHGAVRVRLHRARQRMATLLSDPGPLEEALRAATPHPDREKA